ncbi:hypothetical protein AAEI00_18710 [Shewanella algae]|uniref:hypothetical protein n=1 Tax=Shewanella algae TaxID=38313 RepID=UPI0030062EF6
MKVHDNHLYHGAALIQVAEHKSFTAINSLKIGAKIHPNAYKINDEIALYLKYATKKTRAHSEYIFTFTPPHLTELSNIRKGNTKTYIALVCVGAREICCISYEELVAMIDARKAKKGAKESQYTILVTVPTGKSMRVYINAPGVKNTMLGKPKIIKRSDFPGRIFG